MASENKTNSDILASRVNSLDPHESARLELRRAALEYHEFPTLGKSLFKQASSWLTNTTWLLLTPLGLLRRVRKS